MPKIEAPTVAEHHVMRRGALVAAARELLVTGGAAAVTPAAVATRAGLARTSVYQYFPSTGALVAAAVEATFAEGNEALARVAGEGDPRSRIHGYVRHALELAVRDHGSFRQPSFGDLPPECAARVRELHAAMLAPLRSAVEDLGVRDATLGTALVFGAVSAAAEVVERGADAEATVARTLAFVDAGLDAVR